MSEWCYFNSHRPVWEIPASATSLPPQWPVLRDIPVMQSKTKRQRYTIQNWHPSDIDSNSRTGIGLYVTVLLKITIQNIYIYVFICLEESKVSVKPGVALHMTEWWQCLPHSEAYSLLMVSDGYLVSVIPRTLALVKVRKSHFSASSLNTLTNSQHCCWDLFAPWPVMGSLLTCCKMSKTHQPEQTALCAEF